MGNRTRYIVHQSYSTLKKNYRLLEATLLLFKVGESSSSSALVTSGDTVSTPLPLVVTVCFFATRGYLVREGVDGCLAREGVDGYLVREGVDGPGSALVVMGGLGTGSSLSRLGLDLSLTTLGCEELEES